MNYEVQFSSQAKKFIKNLDKKESIRILDKFKEISRDPFRYIEHYEGEGYKLRVGDYRALIDVDFKDKIVFVRVLDKRGRVYRK